MGAGRDPVLYIMYMYEGWVWLVYFHVWINYRVM